MMAMRAIPLLVPAGFKIVIIREHMRNADHPTTVLVILSDPQDQETFTARLGQG